MLGLSKFRRDTGLLTGGVRLGGGNRGRGGVTCSSAGFCSFDRLDLEGDLNDVFVLFGGESCEVLCL